jgi:hypothetical protein
MSTKRLANAASGVWLGCMAASLLCVATAAVWAVEGSDKPEPPPDPAWLKEKAQLQALGEAHASAWDLYQWFKQGAHGGKPLRPETVPDWSGIYYRKGSIFRFDVDKPGDYAVSTAKLKPAWRAKYMKRLTAALHGVEFDALGSCLPPGMPRWFTEPYLREFAVTPGETWLMSELANETRRIYTDGRDHPAPEDRYGTFDGDTIGFWDGDKLIAHTDELLPGIYQRSEPDHTGDAQVVEVWRKVDPNTLVADVWVYDPQVLVVPWYTRQTYSKQPNADFSLRIRYYDCVGTRNTQVIKTKNGSTTFKDLNFDKPSGGSK